MFVLFHSDLFTLLSCSLLSSPQLGRPPSPCRTFFISPQEPRSCQSSASAPLPPSPSSTLSPAHHQELSRRRCREEEVRRRKQSDQLRRCGGMRGSSLRGSPAPNTSSCPSPPPTRPSRAPWSRLWATMCTSSPQTVKGGAALRRTSAESSSWFALKRNVLVLKGEAAAAYFVFWKCFLFFLMQSSVM